MHCILCSSEILEQFDLLTLALAICSLVSLPINGVHGFQPKQLH